MVIVVGLTACGKRRDRDAAPPQKTAAEAQVRAAFPRGASVGSPADLHGLTIDDDGAILLPELPDGRALALMTDAWGEPRLDLVASNGRKAKGWTSNTGTCALLDGRRIEFVSCDPHIDDVTPSTDDFAAEESRLRAAFPRGAALSMPTDLHGLATEHAGVVLLPRMPSRQAFAVLADAWGPSDAESWAEGLHHVTIWQRENTCAVLDQCHDPNLTNGACWGRVVFTPCTSAKQLTDDARWGAAP